MTSKDVGEKEYTKDFLAVLMQKSKRGLFDTKLTAAEFDTLGDAEDWCRRLNYQSDRYAVIYVRIKNPSRFEESIEVAKIWSRFLRNGL